MVPKTRFQPPALILSQSKGGHSEPPLLIRSPVEGHSEPPYLSFRPPYLSFRTVVGRNLKSIPTSPFTPGLFAATSPQQQLKDPAPKSNPHCGRPPRLIYWNPGVPGHCSSLRGAVAHLGERFNGIEEVAGSIPASSTTS